MKAGVLRVSGGISSVVVKGDVLGGADQSGIFVGGSIGKVKITGDLSSGDATHPVTIAALGTIGATKAKQAVALKTLSVGGDVSHAQILAGYRRDLPGQSRREHWQHQGAGKLERVECGGRRGRCDLRWFWTQ